MKKVKKIYLFLIYAMKDFQLSKEELKILYLLSIDSRMSYKDISRRTGVAISTVHNMIKRLKQKKIINNFTINVDFKKLGYDITALIGVIVKNGLLEDVEQKLIAHPNVVQVFTVTGSFDIMFIAKFHDTNELNQFIRNTLQKTEGIKHSNTNLILSTLKEGNILKMLETQINL